MRKHLRIWIMLIAPTGVLLAVYFEPTHCMRGWLWGEASFDGRPTSYWRTVVLQDLQTDPRAIISTILTPPRPTWWERVNASVGIRKKVDSSFHLALDPQADDVLNELVNDDNEKVAGFAREALAKMRPPMLAEGESVVTWLELICTHHREPQDFKKLFE